jgi:hypothetical protein
MATRSSTLPRRSRKPRRAAAPIRRRRQNRKKISTTIAPEGYAFLVGLIRSRKAHNLAEAIDLVLEETLRADNRARNEQSAAAYYDSLTAEEIDEENRLGEAISASSEINADE